MSDGAIESKLTVVQRLQNSLSNSIVFSKRQPVLKWSLILSACLSIFFAGYFVSGIQQIFTPLLPPEVCPKGEGGFIIGDCVTHRALLAAETSAAATTIYMWLTLISLFLSAATLIGLIFTLKLNRDALEAAQKGNDVAAENGQAQVRAYLTVTSVSVCLAATNSLFVQPTFKNSGQSPAVDMWWSARAIVKWQDEDEIGGFAVTPPHTKMKETPLCHDIPAQTSWQNHGVILLLPEVEGRVPRVGQLREVCVEIRYFFYDVFDESHPSIVSFVGHPPIEAVDNSELAELLRVKTDYFQTSLEEIEAT